MRLENFIKWFLLRLARKRSKFAKAIFRKNQNPLYVTHTRKMGPFLQNFIRGYGC